MHVSQLGSVLERHIFWNDGNPAVPAYAMLHRIFHERMY